MKVTIHRDGAEVTWEDGIFDGDEALLADLFTYRPNFDIPLTATGPWVYPSFTTARGVAGLAERAGCEWKADKDIVGTMAGVIDGKPSVIAKHMGGATGKEPHPSGSPQSVHDGGKGSVKPKVPRPGVTYSTPHFTYDGIPATFVRAAERATLFHPFQDADDLLQYNWDVQLSPEVKAEFERMSRQALLKFNENYPDALPEDVEFHVVPEEAIHDLFGETGTAAFVDTKETRPTIVVNEGFVTGDGTALVDEYGATTYYNEILTTAPLDLPPRSMIAYEVYRKTRDLDLSKEATLFHELVHIADNHTGFTDLNISPRYDRNWYSEPINPHSDDAPIPSRYAATNPKEFLAEALTDAVYLDNPREHSAMADRLFRGDSWRRSYNLVFP